MLGQDHIHGNIQQTYKKTYNIPQTKLTCEGCIDTAIQASNQSNSWKFASKFWEGTERRMSAPSCVRQLASDKGISPPFKFWSFTRDSCWKGTTWQRGDVRKIQNWKPHGLRWLVHSVQLVRTIRTEYNDV